MKKVCVIGHFGFGETLLNGQTVKTKTVAKELERRYGEENVMKLDTRGGIKALLKLPFVACSALRRCKNVVILPAHNGLRVITPVLTFWNFFFRRSLHYAVIGGWLPDFLKKRRLLRKQLARFDGIYAETEGMRSALDALGLKNTAVMPNCKELSVLKREELIYASMEPYKLCTFSRVMREKGIEDAVRAVKSVNEAAGRTVCTLDIYGQIDGNETEWFESLQKDFPCEIRYGGEVPFDKSVETLKKYFAVLFPTYYSGEGFAGTVIDAYSAGVPVLASDWKYNPEMIAENRTGRLFPAKDAGALARAVSEICSDADGFNRMKENCLEEAKRYDTSEVIGILAEKLA